MRFINYLVFLTIILCACAGEIDLPKKPNDLIEREEMKTLLKEMLLLETGIQNRYQNVAVFYKVMSQSGEHFLKSKGITVDRYERSFEFYVSREDELSEMYTEIMDEYTKEANLLQH